MKLIENKIDFNNKHLNNMISKFHLHPYVMKLLFARNINTEDEITKFLYPTIDGLYNPFRLHDMDKVVEKINYHIEKNSNITIIGDYDTDGICASAILYKYFLSIGKKVNVFLPNRMLDGYGLTMDTVDKVVELYSPNFIITVDCGISCYKEIEYIKSKGIDVVVTDHHEIPEILPDCLIIDPKLEVNKSYPFCNLCGAGVALKVVQALSNVKTALDYISIASIATVADMVPLVDENRVIVFEGLKRFDDTAPIGVKKLVKKLDIKTLTSTDISYKLAPKLNTAGRLEDATISYNLFIEEDIDKINKNITKLLQLNDKRVDLCNKVFDDCERKMPKINVSQVGAIILSSSNWSQGVLGIVCARLVEKYHRPVCLLTKTSNNEYKGSVRSVPGINIFEIMSQCEDLLLRFGGHEQAGGLGILEENIQAFTQKMSSLILKKYGKLCFEDQKYYDIDCNIDEVTYELIDNICKLEPFGFCNPRPVFRINLNNIKFNKMKNYGQHLKYYSKNVDIISYNSGYLLENLSFNCDKFALVEFDKDYFTKKERVSGKTKAIYLGKINTPISFEKQAASAIEWICENKINLFYMQNVEDVLKDDFGTIIICFDYKTYKNIADKNYDVNYDYKNLSSSNGKNTVILCPDKDISLQNYSNVVFADNIGNCLKIKPNNRTNYYCLTQNLSLDLFKNISTLRGDFGAYHNIILDGVNKQLCANDKYSYFMLLKKLNPQNKAMKYDMFCFVLNVFIELDMFAIQYIDNGFKLNKSGQNKTKLEYSKIFSTLQKLLGGENSGKNI